MHGGSRERYHNSTGHVNDGLFKNADTRSYKRLPGSKGNKLTSLEMKVVDYFQIEQHHKRNKTECAFKQKLYFYLICTLYSKTYVRMNERMSSP